MTMAIESLATRAVRSAAELIRSAIASLAKPVARLRLRQGRGRRFHARRDAVRGRGSTNPQAAGFSIGRSRRLGSAGQESTEAGRDAHDVAQIRRIVPEQTAGFDFEYQWAIARSASATARPGDRDGRARRGDQSLCAFWRREALFTASGTSTRSRAGLPVRETAGARVGDASRDLRLARQTPNSSSSRRCSAVTGRYLAVVTDTRASAIRVLDMNVPLRRSRACGRRGRRDDLRVASARWPPPRIGADLGHQFQVWSVGQFKELTSFRRYASQGSVQFGFDGHAIGDQTIGTRTETTTTRWTCGTSSATTVSTNSTDRKTSSPRCRGWRTDAKTFEGAAGLRALVFGGAPPARMIAKDVDERRYPELDGLAGRRQRGRRRPRVGGRGLGVMHTARVEGERVIALAFDTEGTRLATTGATGVVMVWDVATGRVVASPTERGRRTRRSQRRILRRRTLPGTATEPSPSSRDGFDGGNVVNVWDLETGDRVATLPPTVRSTSSRSVRRTVRDLEVWHEARDRAGSSARVWMWPHQALIDEACTRLSRNLTSAE